MPLPLTLNQSIKYLRTLIPNLQFLSLNSMDLPIDLLDWEVLDESENPISNPNSFEEEALDDDSQDGAIKSDYFSLNPMKHRVEIDESSSSISSDNPSWIDPDFGAPYQSNPRSFLSDESEELGFETEEVGCGELVRNEGSVGERERESERERVWWKMPLEIFRVWVLRARPIWSISIAMAMLGVVILGRRLYKMKQKGRSAPLKIAIDDKKSSHFMARAARLNEAFSVVKRVPMIRPSLPAASGITSPFPMASLMR